MLFIIIKLTRLFIVRSYILHLIHSIHCLSVTYIASPYLLKCITITIVLEASSCARYRMTHADPPCVCFEFIIIIIWLILF